MSECKLSREELLEYVSNDLGVPKDKLIFSPVCKNPLTNFENKELGTVDGELGYYVVKETLTRGER